MIEIPGYRIDRELGRGGMAVVYLAEQCSLQREVALKVLDPELAEDPSFRRRFLREGRVAAGLHHRHIVAVHDVGMHERVAYLAMEYLPLGPVTPLAGRMPVREALRCIREVASALAHGHSRGVIHRDVKPDNILRHEDGAFLLADFGVAHLVGASTVLTGRGATAGTPAFMAPELWREGRVDPRIDFYALGAVLFQLLTGRPPYRGDDGWAIGMQHINAPLPQLPPPYRALQGLLARLLAKEPLDRIASSDELAAHIAALEREGVLGDAAAGAPEPPAASPRTDRLLREWPFRDGDRGGAVAGQEQEVAVDDDAAAPGPRCDAEASGPDPPATDRDADAGRGQPAWRGPLAAALRPAEPSHLAALLLLQAAAEQPLRFRAIRRTLRRFHCRTFERDGDVVSAEFHSANEALDCALRLLAEHPGRLRAAVTLGDVARREGRFVGGAAADAATVLRHAGPGELAVSSALQYAVVTPLHRSLARSMRPAMARDDEAHAWVAAAADAQRAARDAWPDSGGGQLQRRRPRPAFALALLLAAAFASVLWWTRDVAPPPEASIAVLPFESVGGGPDEAHFAEGLAIELNDALASVQGLKVAARESAAKVQGGVRDVGKALNVATVLGATVRRDGERLRISAQLSDTRSGFTLWNRTYELPLTDILSVQQAIASEVVQALLGVLPGSDDAPLAQRIRVTGDADAYDRYLRGRQMLEQGSGPTQLDEAAALFAEALEKDPTFARAQAGICTVEVHRYERERDTQALARARGACERAASMDPGLAEVSFALGELHRARGDWEAALEHYRHSSADPLVRARAELGIAEALAAAGRDQEALARFDSAQALDKGNWRIPHALGNFHYGRQQFGRAAEAYRRAIELSPDDVASPWTNLGAALLMAGRWEDASDALYRSIAIEPSQSALNNLATIRFNLGDYGEAAALYRRAIPLAPDFRTRGNLADALALLPDRAGDSAREYRRAADEAEDWLRTRPNDAEAIASLAWYRANLGEREVALSLLARAEAIAGPDAVATQAAEVHARLGDAAAAREALRRALASGHSRRVLAAQPLLAPLLPDAAAAPPRGTGAVSTDAAIVRQDDNPQPRQQRE